MPLTYHNLKNRRFLQPIKNFVESELNIQFQNGDRSFCPFHKDTKDSFRIYINGKDEVRFHCFGECGKDWDIYDLIMLKHHCSFRQAQRKFTEFLGLKDVEFKNPRYQNDADDDSGQNGSQEEPLARMADGVITD